MLDQEIWLYLAGNAEPLKTATKEWYVQSAL